MNTHRLFASLLALIVSTAALVAADLTPAQIKADPETWPAQIKVSETLDYGAVKIPAGTLVDFFGFAGNDLRFQHRQQFYLIEPEHTDLVALASRIASGKAAAEGWRGRVTDYLERKGQQVTARGLAPIPAGNISSDTIFVVYYGSSGCSYCGAALPFLNHTLDLLEQRHPGRIRRVYSTAENDGPAARRYAQALGPGWIAAPIGDRYLWEGLAEHVPAAANSVNFPALAIVTPKGRFLAAGMREGSTTASADAALRKLETLLSAPAGKLAAQ